MNTTADLRPGQTVRYFVFNRPVVKRVLTHNMSDIKRVINMRCDGKVEILKG